MIICVDRVFADQYYRCMLSCQLSVSEVAAPQTRIEGPYRVEGTKDCGVANEYLYYDESMSAE